MSRPARVSRLLLTALLMVAALAFAACGSDEEAASDGAAAPAADGKPESTSIKIGASKIGAYTPLHVADKLGYFKEEGLDVGIEIGAGGAEQLPLAIQGQLQLVVTPITTAFSAAEQGLDIVLMPSPTYRAKDAEPEQTATLVRSDSDIKSVKDLEGKKIAINVINSVNWLYNRAMLDNAGVDLSKITYVEVPFPNMVDALLNKSVDAIVEVQPFVFIGESTGKAKVLAYDFLETEPGVKLTAYGASREWADKNPNTMAAVQRALTKAVEHLQSNPDEATKLIAEYTGSEEKLIEGTGLPEWATEDLTPEEMQSVMDLMLKYEVLKEPQDAGKLLWAPKG
jgi:NitT/TauT family transport system substrate-binding protein